jgi:hypothetical protein
MNPTPPYDSTQDTLAHIRNVRTKMCECLINLQQRMDVHDQSKLLPPEKQAYDEWTPKLKGSTYGSEEYKAFLTAMKPALDNHYRENSHHPEHHLNGIRGMNLFDLLEMLCDWKAAGERHANGSMARSFEVNVPRFGIPDDLANALRSTARELGWLP